MQFSRMKFGIIGTGMIARVHAAAIADMEGGVLHSVYGRRKDAAKTVAEQHRAEAFDDLNAFLSDPELDIVTICTPSGAHREPALAAFAHGKHVICEKPLEVTTTKVDEMISAAAAAGKVLASVLNRRFTPAMDAFREAATLGRFGKITSASCYVKWFRNQAYYDSAPWRGTWALDGGGALMNQAIHAVDALLQLAGPVRALRADAACLAHEGIQVEDMAVALLEFENGARGVIEAATCCASQTGHPLRIQLCGTGGSVFLADETFEAWDFLSPLESDARIRSELMAGTSPGLGANNPAAIQHIQHRRNFEEVVRAIREHREPSTSAREARKAVALIEAIYHSARNCGERVEPT